MTEDRESREPTESVGTATEPPPSSGPHVQPPHPPNPPLGPASAGGPQRPFPGRDRGQSRLVAGLAAAALAVTSGVVGAAGALALSDDDDDTPAPVVSAADPSSEDTNQPDEPLSQAAAAVLPSVVSVNVETGRGLGGQGSGVIISTDGHILTNNHVVAAADEDNLTVTLADGTTAAVEVVGTDPATDLAVIQIADLDEVEELTPATLGSSDELLVGDTVLAIGSPLGLDGSVTSGIVSALNRAITLSESPPFGDQRGSASPSVAVIDAIQTDAAINPGNSGGPLVNVDGEVVGISTAIASLAQGTSTQAGNIGVGFAIPIDDAQVVVEQLIEDGVATHAFLGVQLADSVETSGALIAGVESGSPADEAGLEEGDIVTAVDGEAVRDSADLTAAIRAHAPGDEVTLTIRRDGEEHEISATLASLPTDGE